MRPGQQNRRGRGRSNNNGRKGGQNPLARSFESNGPDVKIRGNASHIAEKYMALARDAMSSGDQVMAENYLQHAEHYNRIIMAAQAQFQEQAGQRRSEFGEQGSDQGQGEGGFEGDDDGYDEQPFSVEGQQRPAELRQNDQPRGYEPQPPMPRPHNNEQQHRGEGRPYEGRQGGGEGQGGGGRSGGEGRQGGGQGRQGGGEGEGRNQQQGEFRGRRNRQRHENNRFRPNQGGGMPANPADIAAMAAANGSGFQDNDRRRDQSDDRGGGGQEPGQDE